MPGSELHETEAVMVPGYAHVPGLHCGSTALRNLLAFHGVEVSEEMAFGLGAGANFIYVVVEDRSPSRFTAGRAPRLEQNFIDLTGAPLRLRGEEDPERAWAMARDAVDEGRPALLLTDLYYLEHYGNSAHFPGHAVVLAGYDDSSALLSDTAFEELQATSLESLAEARHHPSPIYPVGGQMVDLPPGEAIDAAALRAAVPAAIERAASEMLEPSFGDVQGLPALRRLASEIGAWPDVAQDWQWCARLLFQIIERRGTGGGNFRAMYSRFLAEVGHEESALAAEASSRWTALAELARDASERDEPDPAAWRGLGERAADVLEAEERLWEALAA